MTPATAATRPTRRDPTRPNRLATLRLCTREAHARLATVPVLARLMAPDLTQREYIAILQRMHAFHVAIEPAIASACRGHSEATHLMDGWRLKALGDDLNWFEAAPLPAPLPPSLPTIESALGALYVVEGSGLGGRVIARYVADSVGVTPKHGGSFYGSLSADSARLRWGRLTGLLTARTDPDRCIAMITLAALDVFLHLECWLRQNQT